jgi:GntR family transcriptional repressor for pyruvate dehydrogenase complex
MAARKLSDDAIQHAAAGGLVPAGRMASLSAQIIGDVRAALIERRLRPGDTVGTEKELAARYGVSRIVARDALRTLQALGIADIKMGKGGGARVAPGNPRLLAEALAIQLDLIGVGAGEVLDAQRAIECMAAELAAERATAADNAEIKRLLREAERRIGERDEYTRLSKAFHFAVAEASHNRALVIQLVSLDHVAWPLRNTTLTPAVARRVLDVHKELAALIEMRDPAGARRLMDDHMRMIRSRRVSERGRSAPSERSCC